MPVQIGAKAHSFSNPTGLLSDCHRRIEMFLSTLEAVASVIEQPPAEDTARALETVLQYFLQAAPKHVADEEESLFPRLRQHRSDLEAASALSELEQLEDEHRRAAALHASVERLGAQYLSSRGLSGQEVQSFREAVASLVSMYKRHISIEDDLVFPIADRMLSETDKSAIGREMADRRK
jgi:hemerythrin-like domain-containing protein